MTIRQRDCYKFIKVLKNLLVITISSLIIVLMTTQITNQIFLVSTYRLHSIGLFYELADYYLHLLEFLVLSYWTFFNCYFGLSSLFAEVCASFYIK